MKNMKTQTRFASLLSLLLLACTAAFGQLTPSGDSFTSTAAPTKNFGSATTLGVESSETTFIQFNLASIPAGYTGADITQATLKLYVNTVTTAGSFNVDYVNGAWTESTITADKAPALGTTIVASVPLVTTDKNQYILINVTEAVQAWLNGSQANDGIALVGNSPVSATFDSKETTSTSHPAELDIVFAPGSGGGITGITTASGSGLMGGGNSGTLNLSLINTCAAKQILQWTGSAWACASAGVGTVTSVASGVGLTGGPITGSGTLSIATGGVVNTMLVNPSLTVTASTGLTGGGSVALGSSTALAIDTTKVPLLGSANTFTGTQTVNNAMSVTSSSSISLTATSTASGGAGVEGFGSIGVVGEGATGVSGSDNGVAGGIGVNGSDNSRTGYGVVGEGATGVYGLDNTNGGTGVSGSDGSGSGYGVTGSGAVGVLGEDTVAEGGGVWGRDLSGSGFGVGGSGGTGVYGTDNGISGGTGVYGNDTSGKGDGVYGSGGTGVYGTDNGTNGFGVVGTDTSGESDGVLGQGYIGVQGDGTQTGIFGVTNSTSGEGDGVVGVANGGSNTFLPYYAGVWGDVGNTSGNSFAVIGTAVENGAGLFYNNGSAYTTLLAQNYAESNSGALVFQTFGGHFGGLCSIDVSGDLTCSGKVAGVVGVEGGARKVAVYSMQSPENWFEDFGSGSLSNGAVTIKLDPTFAQTVNTGTEYHVFLTPNGDSKGLYVSQKSATSFEVREQGGGSSNVAFDYRVVAKRAGYENVRLADLTDEISRQDAQHQAMQSRMRHATTKSLPEVPAPPKLPAQLKPPILPKLPVLPKPILPTHAAMKPVAAEQK
ncbi:MAG: DNRLRE domain-containing protein [Terriglobales bacterium]